MNVLRWLAYVKEGAEMHTVKTQFLQVCQGPEGEFDSFNFKLTDVFP